MSEQMNRMRDGAGFIAALDQSGGSTPRALEAYGIGPEAWSTDEEMFDLVHAMRTRVMTSPAFTSERILAAILFERTLDSTVEGRPTADYLWDVKGVVPFLKVDKGLEAEAHGARLMKPIPDLDATLAKAAGAHVFGTKMRSVILHADTAGVRAVVDQQFEIADRILDAGLTPIIEPEVDIHASDKTGIELLLLSSLTAHLDDLRPGRDVILKLTIPSVTDFYSGLMRHPRVARIAALSGGYSREEADRRLARNHGLIASFSRALLEGLDAGQTREEFDAALAASIGSICRASTTWVRRRRAAGRSCRDEHGGPGGGRRAAGRSGAGARVVLASVRNDRPGRALGMAGGFGEPGSPGMAGQRRGRAGWPLRSERPRPPAPARAFVAAKESTFVE